MPERAGPNAREERTIAVVYVVGAVFSSAVGVVNDSILSWLVAAYLLFSAGWAWRRAKRWEAISG